MQQREPLGKRIMRFVVMMLLIFIVTCAVVVTNRFSTETLAYIVGGVIVFAAMMLLFAGFGFIVYLYLRFRQPRQPTQQIPIVLQVPQQQPMLPPYSGNGHWPVTQQTEARAWNMIGGEE